MKFNYVPFLLIPLFFTACNNKLEKAVYEGKDISNEASIMRNKDTKEAVLSINTEGKWSLYVGSSDQAIDFKKSFEGDGKGIFPLDVDNSSRNYFQLVTEDGKAILADKHLPMAGGYNFRDLGGTKTKDGKYVKWGKLFRTDDLSNLTDGDLTYLSSIPITSVVDFRTKHEIKLNPDKLPQSVRECYELNISPGNLSLDDKNLDFSKMNGDSLMIQMNRSFITDTVIVNTYKKFFQLIQNENNVPMIFHCSAGKDRTGMGAALILFALGVDEDVVMKDYLLSNKYLAGKYVHLIEQSPALESMFIVKPEYLNASLQLIKEEHGNVENYLTNVLGVDIQKFRETYLY